MTNQFSNSRIITLICILMFVGVSYAPVYPPSGLGPYANGIFPSVTPGEVGSWSVNTDFDWVNAPSPLKILPWPQSDNYLMLTKAGLIYLMDIQAKTTTLVLDISERTMGLGDAGSVGFALHPSFGDSNEPDKQHLFVFYRYHPNAPDWSDDGYNRLSKFDWNTVSNSFDSQSEEILIQQYDRSVWHNGGGLFFDNEGYLYVGFGDEGGDDQIDQSTQTITGGLFSGLIRIDVDNDATRSHPIRRQPIHFGTVPQGLPGSFTQGYMIPNDNPWLDEMGGTLEEFYAIGIRSPYSTHYDAISDEIWVADVGSDKREEISMITKGGNLQWPYMEGTIESEVHSRPNQLIGEEVEPVFDYERDIGTAIIGGGVYRGPNFPSLYGKYLFADYIYNKLFCLDIDPSSGYVSKTLISDLGAVAADLPTEPGVAGIFILENGEILLATISRENVTNPGKLVGLKQNTPVADPPRFLSQLGVFEDLETLTPVEGVLPYQVNSPLWSDRANKKRWVIIPDGETITFSVSKNWTFPKGTVFVKHFELPLSLDGSLPNRRLETRFFVMGDDGIGYGVTYKWNEEGTDAELLTIGVSEEYDIYEGGAVAMTQTWDYPSRDQCLSCHNSNADYVLGVKTHQLNGDLDYGNGLVTNQLTYLSDHGYFNVMNLATDNLPRSYAIDDESVNLELRVRSYLDANCSSCHRLGGIADLDMDLRYTLPVNLHNTIQFATKSMSSDQDRKVIEAGNHAESELWIRDQSLEDNRMPPVSRNLVDQVYVDALAEWIDGLNAEDGLITEDIFFPSPSNGTIVYYFDSSWQGNLDISVHDIQGRIIHREKTEENFVTIEVPQATTGVYFLTIISPNKKLTRKFLFE